MCTAPAVEVKRREHVHRPCVQFKQPWSNMIWLQISFPDFIVSLDAVFPCHRWFDRYFSWYPIILSNESVLQFSHFPSCQVPLNRVRDVWGVGAEVDIVRCLLKVKRDSFAWERTDASIFWRNSARRLCSCAIFWVPEAELEDFAIGISFMLFVFSCWKISNTLECLCHFAFLCSLSLF